MPVIRGRYQVRPFQSINNMNVTRIINDTGMHMEDVRQEALTKWRKKAWLTFCKDVIDVDKRFSLRPLGDVFGDMALVRDGYPFDVYIVPATGNALGCEVVAGSKFSKVRFTGYPAKAMIYPLTLIGDELERQYAREVAIESGKHNSKGGRKHGQSTRRTAGNNDDNQLSTST